MTDIMQKRPSVGGIDDDSESRSGVLGLLNKRLGRGSKKLQDGSAQTSSSTATSSQASSSSQHGKVPSLGPKLPLSAREVEAKRVPSLQLPGPPVGSASLSDLPDYSPGRAVAGKKPGEMGDRSLNASTTTLAMRKLFLGKVESMQTDDFTLWKQFRDLEPEFSQEVNSTTPFPFLRIAVRGLLLRGRLAALWSSVLFDLEPRPRSFTTETRLPFFAVLGSCTASRLVADCRLLLARPLCVALPHFFFFHLFLAVYCNLLGSPLVSCAALTVFLACML